MTQILRTIPPLDQFDHGIVGVASVTRNGVSYADSDATNIQAKATALGILLATGYVPGYTPGTGSPFAVKVPVIPGPLASRPATSEVAIGQEYQAVDDNGGKRYRSDGAAWVPQSPGVTELPNSGPLGRATLATSISTTSVYPTYVDATGLTGVSVTLPASGKMKVRFKGALAHNAAGKAVLLKIVDEAAAIVFEAAGQSIASSTSTAPSLDECVVTGTPGVTKTYKVQWCINSAGTGTIGANLASAYAMLEVIAA